MPRQLQDEVRYLTLLANVSPPSENLPQIDAIYEYPCLVPLSDIPAGVNHLQQPPRRDRRRWRQ